MEVRAPVPGKVVDVRVTPGEPVSPGDHLVILEVMKMELPLTAGVSGTVSDLLVDVGALVDADDLVAVVAEGASVATSADSRPGPTKTALDEVMERHALILDDARRAVVEKRHAAGRRTAREYLADLCYEFVEYGPLAIAAQRSRRTPEDLIENTPADGLVGGVGRVDTGTTGDDRVVALSYDYTVLAGTQGMQNHRKKDRLFALAADTGLPVVLFAEGGGGRPGDVDYPGVSLLDVPAFRLFAEIPGPTIGVNTGYCFAGNAALLGQCDVILSTPHSNLGMGGPAMIEGGGLGRVAPTEIGPVDVQSANGVIDLVVEDDVAAVWTVRALLGMIGGPVEIWEAEDQDELRVVIPPERKRVYDVRAVIGVLADSGSFIEFRAEFGKSVVTGLGRVEGRPLGIVANDPTHLAGAIDHSAAVTIERHMRLCGRWGLPILFVCDTPGFMVGPEAEAEGLVRSAGALFRTAAAVDVPTGTIVTRRGFGLGAQAMTAGGFHENRFTVGWPASEFGPMGIEGAVKLGFKKELDATDGPEERDRLLQSMVQEMSHLGRGVNVASHFEIDDVIDPADSRRWITNLLFD